MSIVDFAQKYQMNIRLAYYPPYHSKYNPSPIMEELYGNWKSIAAPTKACHSTKGLRTEVLWVNYEVDKIIKNNLEKNQTTKAESQCQPQLID